MARTLHRLSPGKVKNAKPGMHADGGGLYLQATLAADKSISKSWIFRFCAAGRERHMGLGSLLTVSLADARQRAAGARKLREQGIDPIQARDASTAVAVALQAKQMTFDQCAAAYVKAHRAGWRNVTHAAQWANTLAADVSPVIGKASVRSIDTAMVMAVLEPMWTAKPETASRIRGRIESILDWAKVRGFRDGDNPARWRGHLDHLLPRRSKLRTVKHHVALPFAELPTFLKRLRAQKGVAARALEWTILTAVRTQETTAATAGEIYTGERTWTIPAERMKAGKEHKVPLCNRAMAIIDELAPLRGADGHLFPGRRRGGLGNGAMLKVLKAMGHADLTVHGFRSAFRDWAAERSSFPSDVIEMALAHAIPSAAEAAYRRGDLLDKRRRLMDEWARYCKHGQAVPADVVALRA